MKTPEESAAEVLGTFLQWNLGCPVLADQPLRERGTPLPETLNPGGFVMTTPVCNDHRGFAIKPGRVVVRSTIPRHFRAFPS